MIPGRSRSVKLAGASQSHPGRLRDNNEDLPIFEPELDVYGVIDGVGGKACGEVAAAIAHKAMRERLARLLGPPSERVREAMALANNAIVRNAEEVPEREGMACVATVGLVTGNRLTLGHVGDTRAYRIGPRGILKLTRDHSPVGEREDAREITERDAMQHPRRNEVLRLLGGARRDKDADEFVDVSEVTIRDDEGLLFCSDGLTDMVPLTIIEQRIRQHAGDPQAVVNALVAAANDAGGRDNITAVYLEARNFASAIRNAPPLPVLLREDAAPTPAAGIALTPARTTSTPRPSTARLLAEWTWSSRATWFALGMAIGAAAAIALAWNVLALGAGGSRTLTVGGSEPAFRSIAEASRQARAGDTIRVEPGRYVEQVLLPDGVHLAARVPGETILAAPDATSPSTWTALSGTGGGRISGIRIESTPTAPLAIGVKLTAGAWDIDGLELHGGMRTGIDVSSGVAATIRLSRFQGVDGPAITHDQAGSTTVTASTFVAAAAAHPALSLRGSPQVTLQGNVFVGYGATVVAGVASDIAQQLMAGNLRVAAPSTLR